MNTNFKNISKFMSLVLRHKPEEIALHLDENGWAEVNEFIDKMNNKGFKLDFDTLENIVNTNEKKRFAFNDAKTLIRASQGHSIDVDLQLKEVNPPEILYHGTAEKYLNSILTTGIQKQSRQHVHLSETLETAQNVGSRHGKVVVLKIDTETMVTDGFEFYLSENNVWLVNEVPVKYIEVWKGL